MTSLHPLFIFTARWIESSRSGMSNDWHALVAECVDPDGVLRLTKTDRIKLVREIQDNLDCTRIQAKAKLEELFSQLTQSHYGKDVRIELIETDIGIVYPGLWGSDEDTATTECTACEAPYENDEPEDNASSSQASITSSGPNILSNTLPSPKISSAQTFAAQVIATSLRASTIFLGLRSPIPQSGIGVPDATAQLGANPVLGTVGFEAQRSLAPLPAANLPSADELDLTIAFEDNIVRPTDLVTAGLAERVQLAAIPMGLLGSNGSFKLFDSPQQTEPVKTTNLAENLPPSVGQPVTQDLDTSVVNLETKIAILLKCNSRLDSSLNSPLDRPVIQAVAEPKVEPRDNPLASPIEKPGDRPLDNNKLDPVVEPPGPIAPVLPLPAPLPPVIKNPDLPVDVDLPRPVEIDLPKDTPTTVVIPSGPVEISGFVGVGRGSSPSAQTILDVDILQFTGSGQIARYLQMEQQNKDVVITFEGNDLVKVVLKNLALDEIDNLDPLTGASAKVGNIIFAGETTTSSSFDVFNSDWYRSTLFNRNTTTFLNDLDNFVYGFDNSDDVINGQGGNDVLFGLGGNDLLRGGSGDDILNGGLGYNQLVGNSGKDTFVITPGGLSDVMDFTLGTDKIQLAQGTTYDRLTLTNFTEGNRGCTQIWQSNQVVLRVFGVAANQLTSDQFVPGQNDRLP
jgi:RTX calcium-binding nonapeptide repeat (4 copies)